MVEPDMTEKWARILFEIWTDGREYVGWAELLRCHDQEDQDYFEMLDNYRRM